MRFYLCKNPLEKQTAVHGVDYKHGLEEGQECGSIHEFHTRKCQPVLYTEEEKNRMPDNVWVEVVPFRRENENRTDH